MQRKVNDADQEIIQKIIEELLCENDEEPKQPRERKINPLQRANKHFLGRTIHAVVKHNERADEINRRKCRNKLKELDDRHRSRRRSEDNGKTRKRNYSKNEKSSSDSSLERRKSKDRKSKYRKKYKRKKRHRHDTSSSRSSSSSSHISPRRDLNCGRNPRVQTYDWRNEEVLENPEAVTEMQNYAAWMMNPMLWSASMTHLCQLNALMHIGAAAQTNLNETAQIEELSVSSSSLSDVNFEEVNEYKPSKFIDTIDVTTGEEDNDGTRTSSSKGKKKSAGTLDVEKNCIEITDSDADVPIVDISTDDENERDLDNCKKKNAAKNNTPKNSNENEIVDISTDDEGEGDPDNCKKSSESNNAAKKDASTNQNENQTVDISTDDEGDGDLGNPNKPFESDKATKGDSPTNSNKNKTSIINLSDTDEDENCEGKTNRQGF